MFDRYYSENSEWVPRDSLSTVTKIKLRALEKELGYQFSNEVRKAQFGHAPSYLIYGESSDGEEIVYERRETGGRGAGQTYLWIDGKRHQASKLFEFPKSFAQVGEELAGKFPIPGTFEVLKDLGVDTEGLDRQEVINMGGQPIEEPTELKIVCAWCGKDMGIKDGEGITGITHSICPDCFKWVLNG